MNNWEFLLQKEGDHQWRTAQKSQLRLRVGSYCIVAWGQPNTPVDVHIRCQSQDVSGETIQHGQSRSQTTNQHGFLLIVAPLTQLKVGHWQITCCGDDSLQPWEKSLQLDIVSAEEILPQPVQKPDQTLVFPPSSRLFSFEPDIVLGISEPDTEQIRHTSEAQMIRDSLLNLMADESHQHQEQSQSSVSQDPLAVFNDVSDELTEFLQSEPEAIWQETEFSPAPEPMTSPETAPPDASVSPVAIALDHHQLTWNEGHPLHIQGSLRASTPLPEEYRNLTQQPARLKFCLRHPQTGDALATREQVIIPSQFPYPFEQILTVDPQWQTPVIEGEITFEADLPANKILATQNFTITSEVHTLIADDLDPDISANKEAESPITEEPLGLTFSEPEENISSTLDTQTISFSITTSRSDSTKKSAPPKLPSLSHSPLPSKLQDTQKVPAKAPELPLPDQLNPIIPRDSVGEAFLEESLEDTEPYALLGGQIPSDSAEDLASEDRLDEELPIEESSLSTPVLPDNMADFEEPQMWDSDVDIPPVDHEDSIESEPETIPLPEPLKLQEQSFEFANDLVTENPTPIPPDNMADLEEQLIWDSDVDITPVDHEDSVEPEPESVPLPEPFKLQEQSFEFANDLVTDNPTPVFSDNMADFEEQLMWDSDIEITSADHENSVEPEPETISLPEPFKLQEQSFEFANDLAAENLISAHFEDLTPPWEENISQSQPAISDNNFPVDDDSSVPASGIATETSTLNHEVTEIVVDDTLDDLDHLEISQSAPVIYDASGLPYPQQVLTDDPEIEHSEAVQVVPEPLLMLDKLEFQVEEMARVRVQLPPYPDRLYVKLWLQDRQTRRLLSEPYQLIDFETDAASQPETALEIKIPAGVAKIRFEAIAIDPKSRQESRKAGIDCNVLPPQSFDQSVETANL